MKKQHELDLVYRSIADSPAINNAGKVQANNRPLAIAQRQLAHTISNNALPRIAQRGIVQRRKFKDGEMASAWLSAQLNDDTLALPAEGDEWEFFSTRLQTDNELSNDLVSNVNSLMQVWEGVREATQNRRDLIGLEKKRTLTAKQKTHILEGEFENGKITGGHHGPTCIKNGFSITNKESLRDGFYKAVLNRKYIVNNKEKIATKSSTFFPDSWSQFDIISAIEYAEKPIPAKPIYVITTLKGKGINLHYNDDSCFPIFQP